MIKRGYTIYIVLFSFFFLSFSLSASNSDGKNKHRSKYLTAKSNNIKNINTISVKNMDANGLPDFSAGEKNYATVVSNNLNSNTSNFILTKLSVDNINYSENGTVNFLSGNLGSAIKYKSLSTPNNLSDLKNISEEGIKDFSAAMGWISEFSYDLGLENAAEEFKLINYKKDPLGKRHIKLQQVYKAIPVWAEEAYVHINENDEIYLFSGRYEKTPVEINNFEASISKNTALKNTIDHFVNSNIWHPINEKTKEQFNIPETKIEKVIWYDEANKPHLVWFLDIYANEFDWYYVFVDANSGEILDQILNTAQEGFVDASGTDLNGVVQNFRAFQSGDKYVLLSDINHMRSALEDLPKKSIGGAKILDLRNASYESSPLYYLILSDNQNSWVDASSVSAMTNAQICVNYWEDTHNRFGIDGDSSTVYAVVNVERYNKSMPNAFWNGKAMFYGNGGGWAKPFAGALDVAGHEMAHGVIGNTAGLIYRGQSGALNESFADFFGAMVDRDDWLSAEDIVVEGFEIDGRKITAGRDLENPGGQHVLSPQPASMDEYKNTSNDRGGVHINSGIVNRAAVIIAKAIGKEKTEQIYYRALSSYLLRQSIFIDCRFALEQSAKDLYGEEEANAVSAAYDEVKIFGDKTDPRDFIVDPVSGGQQYIAYVRGDGEIGLIEYIPNDRKTYQLSNLKVKSEDGYFSQLSFTENGKHLYFVNENGFIQIVDLSSFQNSRQYTSIVLDSVYVETPGDLWNVSVRRDDAMFAFTSHYGNDNNVYFSIEDELYYLELLLPTTAEGIENNSIKFLDVIDWSPNIDYPKLAFDAYHEITSDDGGNLGWWNIGEVDLGADSLKIYELLPASPDNYSLGNIEYSSTNPSYIAFTAHNKSTDRNDIFLRDFSLLNLPKRVYDSSIKLGRASFSFNDKWLVVENLSDRSQLIWFYSSSDSSRSGYFPNIMGDAYNPQFFVLGGITDIEEEIVTSLPDSYNLSQNYPNPFNPSTTISYALPESGFVELKIFDMLGRKIATLVNKQQSAGSYEIVFDSNGVASGMYLYQINAGKFSQTKKMLLMK